MKKFLILLITLTFSIFLVACGTQTPPSTGAGGGTTGGGNPPVITPPVEDVNPISAVVNGGNETIHVEIQQIEGAHFDIAYTGNGTTLSVDSKLILTKTGLVYCDIPGLKGGDYSVKVSAQIDSKSYDKTYNNINVASVDRSGYAQFGTTVGVGAYNNDGSLKEGTDIIYLTNANKNTVTYKIGEIEYVGIVGILKALKYAQNPVCIRVVDNITTNQWSTKNVAPRLTDNSNFDDTYFNNTLANTYGDNIVGLTNKVTDKKVGKTYTYTTTLNGISQTGVSSTSSSSVTYSGTEYPEVTGKKVYADDCAFNMVEVSDASNITIEGVSSKSQIFQWGIQFSSCKSIEIRNIAFKNYPEDALSFTSSSLTNGRVFIHNVTFNAGKNNWDISGERDKATGDGSIDIGGMSNITIAYCQFNNCKKTMLMGRSDSEHTKNVTIHHNYFNTCQSRLPLARHVNIHMYNNYFENNVNCTNVRAGAYAFCEYNYYLNNKKVHIVQNQTGVAQANIKSFNEVFSNCDSVGVSKVTTRQQTVANGCDPDTKSDYTAFDTNTSLFYYDAVNNKSNVSILTAVNDVPEFVTTHAGLEGKYTKL